MAPYLDRYLSGEHEQVWRELTQLGAQVRSDPVYPDALAVARETMRRACHNIEILIPRPREADYAFGFHALGLEETLSSLLEIMLDVDIKFGYSGLGGYQVIVPCQAADAPLLGEPHDLSFVDYVRLACRWGGFPGLQFGGHAPEEAIRDLTKGLLPL